MAGKHYGGVNFFNDNVSQTIAWNPNENRAWEQGWRAGVNPFSSNPAGADYPLYLAAQNGVALTGVTVPPNQTAGRRWEVAGL